MHDYHLYGMDRVNEYERVHLRFYGNETNQSSFGEKKHLKTFSLNWFHFSSNGFEDFYARA